MSAYAAHWILDPAVAYLNHGSFGACPAAVLQRQTLLREELEREPVDFLDGTLPERLARARETLAQFLGADPLDLAFVPNATTGVNAVLRSLDFEPEDELLLTTHTYAACRKTLEFVAARTGARLVRVSLPFPLESAQQILSAVLAAVTPRTRLALLDHVTSPTALILPIAALVRELRTQGVETLVDGAHAPGMVPLDLRALGAAYYTGNAHKWLCAPKGAAFLHVRPDRQSELHPTAISHGYRGGFREEFDWTGTCDPTAWLCIPEALRVMGALLPGGWTELMARNHRLALHARSLLTEALGVPAPCPAEMIGSMASIPLPAARAGAAGAGLNAKALHDWFRARGIETWMHEEPVPLVRASAQLYNDARQFERLAQLLRECLHGG
ncbi:MAG TPA: aminotransferase class V-fold PLP-dependent enzyme [Steroidobacteraceae bacterium]|nr:aminotransferase class V-fold PLP-dependent enzyme [Steroidobacteraceae bacterium]